MILFGRMKKIGVCVFVLLVTMLIFAFSATAFAQEKEKEQVSLGTIDIIQSIFGNEEVDTIEYLYGFDESADYIYVNFTNYGYAVFLRSTMEMLEYSPKGELPFGDTFEKKYYAGPGNSYTKKGAQFVNTFSKEELHLTKEEASEKSRLIVQALNASSKKEQTYDIPVEQKGNEASKVPMQTRLLYPSFDEDDIIIAKPIGAAGTTYIPNAEYFTANPEYGKNVHGTCGSVAVQLLLSYHNFYTDRRIIGPEHLNGGWLGGNIYDPDNYTNPEWDPNACHDPGDLRSTYAIGTRSGESRYYGGVRVYETDPSGFYHYVIDKVEPNVLNCTVTIVDVKVNNATNRATVTTIVVPPAGASTVTVVERDAAPGEEDKTTTTHSSCGNEIGSITQNIYDGLNTILSQRLAGSLFTVNGHLGPAFGLGAIDRSYIVNQINVGNPVIVSTSPILSGMSHWAVAYGYQNYTYQTGQPHAGSTYFGYIVHPGWSGYDRMWINENWCNSCVTLELAHQTHFYNSVGVIDDAFDVYRCTLCGHRKAEAIYELDENIIIGTNKVLVGEVSIPSAIRDVEIQGIGETSFANQTQLTKVDIPRSVRTIGAQAFKNCTSLGEVKLFQTTWFFYARLDTIGDEAFSGCTALYSIKLPDSVTQIGFLAFDPNTALDNDSGIIGANIDLIVWAGTASSYASWQNKNVNIVEVRVEYNAFKITSGQLRGDVVIPSTLNGQDVTKIDNNAFLNQTQLRSVSIFSATRIGSAAFSNCTNLEEIWFKSGYEINIDPLYDISYTNYYYTEHCLYERLEAGITYTLSFYYDNLTASTDFSNVFTSLGVGETCFAVDLPVQSYFGSSDHGWKTIVFTPTERWLTTSNKLWCRFIRTSTPQSVSVTLTCMTINVGVESIENNAFNGCSKLASPSLSYRLLQDNTYAVEGWYNDLPGFNTLLNRTLFIPSTHNNIPVTQIDAQAFRNADWLNNGDGGWIERAFFQAGLTTIGNRAFQFCYNLRTVNLSKTSVTRIEDYTFDTCLLGHYFQFPTSLTYIGEGAFIRAGYVENIPNSVTTIGDYAFSYRSSSTSQLPTGLTTIGSYAFFSSDMSSLKKIPASVTSIGSCAFMNSGLSDEFFIAPNSSLYYIGPQAFCNNELYRIVLPSTVSTVGSYAFTSNDHLTIYTEHGSKPVNWNSNWNSSNRPVFWGCTLSSDKSYVLSFTKSASNPSNANATNGITNPSRDGYNFDGWYTTSDFSGTRYANISEVPAGVAYVKWTKQSCVAEGTLITLADGTHVAVEDLTGEEELLVWNLLTGQFDSAPIIFVDSDPYTSYEITHLYFSDGTEVKVIDEHAFWDVNLNEYVFLRNDAAQYIGHWFNKQITLPGGGMTWTTVQLVDVDVYQEYTTAWSPVTFGHLCFYVNDMLSMPGATEGLINIFEVDPLTMSYDAEAFAADIAEYGLFTYQEFAALIPIPEEVFYAFSGQYLKVSIGKGLITLEEIALLIERYSVFFA